jgi:hypothetical protein
VAAAGLHGGLIVDPLHPHHFIWQDGTRYFLMGYECDFLWILKPAEMRKLVDFEGNAVGVLDTFAGRVHVRWVPEAAVSSLGLLAYFIEFLKVSARFDAWVADCPLEYTSGNAPQKRDVLGTILLSLLAGHWRYAQIGAIRGDGVNPGLPGMTKVASEDSVRRAMKALDKESSGYG